MMLPRDEITLGDVEVLFFLLEAEQPVRMEELADGVGVKREEIAERIGRLSDTGFVEKGDDSNVVQLTKEGREKATEYKISFDEAASKLQESVKQTFGVPFEDMRRRIGRFGPRPEHLRVIAQFQDNLNRISRSITVPMNHLRRIQAQIAPSLERMAALSNSGVARQIAQAARLANHSMFVGYSRALAPVFGAMAQIEDFKRGMAPVLEFIKEVEESDYPFKWLQSVPVPFHARLYLVYREQGTEAVGVELLKLGKEEELHETILESCDGSPHLNPAKGLVSDALWAHREEKYSLSIPVLLCQVEGSLRRMAVELGEISPEEAGLVEDNMPKRFPGPEDLIKLINAKEELLFAPFVEYLETLRPERDHIFHGNVTDYANPELATECIFAIYELSNTRLPEQDE